MELNEVLFWIIAVLTGLCAIAVVVSQNIVRSATWLLFTLAGVSGIFFLLGADFVGATQLLVYVGGTLVLVVFGVMLTAQGPFVTMKTGAGEWAISLAVGLLFLGVLVICLVQTVWPPAPAATDMDNATTSMSSDKIGLAVLGFKQATPRNTPMTGVQKPPTRTPMAYLLPFEIVSVHLLVVLLGAAYLARAKRRRGATP